MRTGEYGEEHTDRRQLLGRRVVKIRVHSFPDTTLTVKLMRSPLNKVASIRGYRVLINVKCKHARTPTCKHVQVKHTLCANVLHGLFT